MTLFKIILPVLIGLLALNFFVSNTEEKSSRVEYKIADIRLDIPLTFHYGELQSRGRWPTINSGVHETSYISIYAVLPELTAYNEENNYKYKELGWGDKINIVLTTSHKYSFDEIVSNYVSSDLLIPTLSFMQGLEHFSLKISPTGRINRDFYIRKIHGKIDLLAQCSLPDDAVSPSCQMERKLKYGLNLKYTFSRKYIENWENISNNILNLLNSFCVNENNCLQLNKGT